MKLKEVVEKLGLEVRSAAGELDREVAGGYVSDMLSDILANCEEGDIWVTIQVHENVVAVASMKNVSAVILANGREPYDQTREKAETEGVPILLSPLPAFEIVGRLYALGIK